MEFPEMGPKVCQEWVLGVQNFVKMRRSSAPAEGQQQQQQNDIGRNI